MPSVNVKNPEGRVIGRLNFPEGTPQEQIRDKAQAVAQRFGGAGTVEAARSSGVTRSFDEGLLGLARTEGPQLAGGVAGGIRGAQVGGLVGGPPGAIAGGVGGAFLGGGGAELARQGIEAVFGTEQAPESLSQAFDRAGRAGTQQAVGELVGMGVLWGGGQMLKPFVRSVTPEATRAAAFLDPLVEGGERLRGFFRKGVRPATLRPAEATNNRFLDILDNITNSAVFGGRVRAQEMSRQAVLDKWQAEFVEGMGKSVSPSDLGQAYIDAVAGRWSPWQEYVKTGWNTLEASASAKNVTVDIRTIRGILADPIRKAKLPGSPEMGQTMLRALEELPANATFGDVKAFRSKVLRLQRAAKQQGEDPGAFKLLNDQLTKAMGKALKEQAPELVKDWSTLRELTATSNDRFNNNVVRSLRKAVEVNGQPQQVVQKLFTKENVQQIRRVRESTNEENFGAMQRWFMEDVLNRTGGKGTVLLDDMAGKGKGAAGRDVYREVLGPQKLRQWEEFANAAAVIQERQAEGLGRMMIQLTQSGALVRTAQAATAGELARRGRGTEAAIILVGPSVLGRIMTNEKTARLFIKGMRMPAVGKTSKPEFISQLLAAVATAEDEAEQERETTIARRPTGAF